MQKAFKMPFLYEVNCPKTAFLEAKTDAASYVTDLGGEIQRLSKSYSRLHPPWKKCLVVLLKKTVFLWKLAIAYR